MDFENFEFKKDRNLSPCETIIMKAIWSAGEDISIPALIELLKTEYNKDYAKTTVVTFLLHLSDKGFVVTYRKGRLSYAHPLKTEVEYRAKLMKEETDFWFQGKPAAMVAALCSAKKFTKEEVMELRELLDGMDD